VRSRGKRAVVRLLASLAALGVACWKSESPGAGAGSPISTVESYPGLPRNDKAGFIFGVPKLAPGPHSLTVLIVAKDGGARPRSFGSFKPNRNPLLCSGAVAELFRSPGESARWSRLPKLPRRLFPAPCIRRP
jgi:hypothetical protein